VGTSGTVTGTLLALTLATVGLTAWEAAEHGMTPLAFVPAGLLVAILLAWPFLNGWRPWTAPGRRWLSCGGCGTQWRPADEGGLTRCPVCT
jgi:hypothetical protein